MKNTLKKFSLVVLLFGITFLVNAQSVSLPSARLLSAPLNILENNGSGFASFDFAESSSVAVQAEASGLPNVTISVNLNYVELTDFDANMVTGSLLDYFNVSYNSNTNILLFEQENTIPGDWFGSVSFPIKVIQNSLVSEAFNGFNANISAIDSNTNAEGNASVYTYTSESAVAADNDLVFENLTVYPIPTDDILNIDNDNAKILNISVYDAKGSLVFEQKIENQKNTIDVESLADGVYYLKIYDASSKSYKNIKFIVK